MPELSIPLRINPKFPADVGVGYADIFQFHWGLTAQLITKLMPLYDLSIPLRINLNLRLKSLDGLFHTFNSIED